jgi:hypothetical protein
MNELPDNTRIKLNVGGMKFETTYLTLKQSSMFRSWLSRWKIEEELFVDRSGLIFEHVLNYLRNPLYYYPEDDVDELGYYGIDTKPANIKYSNAKLEYCYKAIKQTSGLCAREFCLNKPNRYRRYCDDCGIVIEVKRSAKIDDIVRYKGNSYIVSYTGPYVVSYNHVKAIIDIKPGDDISIGNKNIRHPPKIISDGYVAITIPDTDKEMIVKIKNIIVEEEIVRPKDENNV